MRYIILLFLLIISVSSLLAQKRKSRTKSDTLQIQKGYVLQFKDSTLILSSDTIIVIPRGTKYKIKKSPELQSDDFYTSLGDKSEKKWVTKQLYDALIVGTPEANNDTIAFLTTEESYNRYEGWTISNISYKQVDVIAGDVYDTLRTTNSGIIRILNDVKSHTRIKVLRKNTIVKINDIFEPKTIADNERLLRELPYIVEARIYAESLDSINQKVKLIIVTQDQFSIGVTPSYSSISKFALGVYDRNIFGTGSELSYTYAFEKDTIPENGSIVSYSMDNIAGTFTNGRIEYRNIPGTEGLTIDLSKRFITPSTKIGGGFTFDKKADNWLFLSTDTSLYIPYSGNFIDVWTGYSPQFFSRASRKQVVLSARFDSQTYSKRPLIESDTNQQFANNKLWLASTTFRRINYVKSKLLVGFGRAEDVPVGESIHLTGGYIFSELESMPYIGIGMGMSRFVPFGIIGFKLDFGGFIDYNDKILSEGAFAAKLTYYTPLYLIKKFTFRTSLKVSYLNGINMPSYKVTNINGDIRGISGTHFYGQDKLIGSFETVAFTPWYLLGFRFAIYGFADVGFLGFNNKLISSDHMYSGIGAGVRLRNENLVFRTIQLRFTFYNLRPEGITSTSFDFNTTDEQLFNAIEVGKPDIVRFN